MFDSLSHYWPTILFFIINSTLLCSQIGVIMPPINTQGPMGYPHSWFSFVLVEKKHKTFYFIFIFYCFSYLHQPCLNVSTLLQYFILFFTFWSNSSHCFDFLFQHCSHNLWLCIFDSTLIIPMSQHCIL